MTEQKGCYAHVGLPGLRELFAQPKEEVKGMKEAHEPCKHCSFDHGFITDYKEDGTEYEFCHNCGTVVGEGDKQRV